MLQPLNSPRSNPSGTQNPRKTPQRNSSPESPICQQASILATIAGSACREDVTYRMPPTLRQRNNMIQLNAVWFSPTVCTAALVAVDEPQPIPLTHPNTARVIKFSTSAIGLINAVFFWVFCPPLRRFRSNLRIFAPFALILSRFTVIFCLVFFAMLFAPCVIATIVTWIISRMPL